MDDDKQFLIALGKEVRGWRNTRGLTITQLAQKAGVGKATVERLENATTATSVSNTWAVADALGVPLSTLVRRAEETAGIMRATRPAPRNEGLPGDEREAMWAAMQDEQAGTRLPAGDADLPQYAVGSLVSRNSDESADDLATRRQRRASEVAPRVSERAVAKRRKDRGENDDDQEAP